MTSEQDDGAPRFPLRIGDSNQQISGIIALSPKILVEITVTDILSGQVWRSGRVPAPPPLDAFGDALNKFRASITYPVDPAPPTRTLNPDELRPYCWRYRHAFEYANLDEQNLKLFRLQLFKEWETKRKEQQVFPYRPDDRGAAVQKARKAERRNFSDALDGYLKEWIKNRQAEPYENDGGKDSPPIDT